MVKNPRANEGDTGDVFDSWVRKIPWRRKWQPTAVSCLEILWTKKPGGLQSMGLKELNTTEVTNNSNNVNNNITKY